VPFDGSLCPRAVLSLGVEHVTIAGLAVQPHPRMRPRRPPGARSR
jgi:hypothetical protein